MQLVVIAHNLRSIHNVGSLLRTADGLGVSRVIFTGYTPFPALLVDDPRLPHEREKITKMIHKTALGAEFSQVWNREENVFTAIDALRADGFTIAALEQTPESIPLPSYRPPEKLAIILGREVEGMESEVLEATDLQLEIPMVGQKESFNVVEAATMAMYHCILGAHVAK